MRTDVFSSLWVLALTPTWYQWVVTRVVWVLPVVLAGASVRTKPKTMEYGCIRWRVTYTGHSTD
jgi:hypothetical protein